MSAKKICIIGGGNLGISILEGILSSHFVEPQNIIVTKRNLNTLQHLKTRKINITSDNPKSVKDSDIIILCVKPFNVKEVLEDIKESFQSSKNKILISTVTGIAIEEYEHILGKDKKIYRAMPNTAIAVKESMTCICKNGNTLEEDDLYIQKFFNQVGKTIIIEEKYMDASTVIGACGIAYALRFIRASIQGGIEIGFNAKVAGEITAQTVKGAASLLIETQHHPEEEIDKVTTPMGCTIRGLNEMEHHGFSSSLMRGIIASYNKIKE